MTTMFAAAPRTIHLPLLVACVGCALLFSEGVAADQLPDGNSRRRQAINDALAGKDPVAVVESVMQPGNDPAYLAIRIASKKALSHLYELLGERDARPYALHGILLASDFSDPASMAELKRAAARARTANDWAEMQCLEEVIAIALEPASRKLMTVLLTLVRDVLHQEGVDTTDTQIALAQYLASGRDPKALERALEMAGDNQRYGSRFQALSIVAFGDSYLGPEDLPPLMRRAADAKASTAVRVGAIRLLECGATADAGFMRLRKNLTRSDDSAVRDAAG